MSHPNWLVNIYREAQANKWCMDPSCFCFGSRLRANIYQRAYLAAGYDNIEIEWDIAGGYDLDLPHIERKNLFNEVASELKSLDDLFDLSEDGEFLNTSGLRILLMHLDRKYKPQEVGRTLDDFLGDSAAGNYLAQMRDHDRALRDEHARRSKLESQKRKRKLEEAEQRRHIQRIRDTVQPKAQRERIATGIEDIHIFLREFTELTTTEKLKKLAENNFAFTLDHIPRNLIPVDADLEALSSDDRNRLIQLIDKRTRRWGRLKCRLSLNLNGNCTGGQSTAS